MTTTPVPEQLLRALRSGNRLLLSSHVSPDGDAIGSELALARVLRSLGKAPTIWNRDPTPGLFQVVPGSERIHGAAEPPSGFPTAFDAIVVLECPALERTGLAEHLGPLSVINIDHHLGNQHYGAINWVEPAAPALGTMIYRIARALNVPLDAEVASLLLMTLVTDTGGFRFANATPEAFEAAAGLVREGARPEEVARWVYESRPEASVRLLGEMLGSLELHAGGRISAARLTCEMFERAGATAGDSEDLIDTARSIAGVEATVLLRELAPDRFKISLRSRGDLDVEKIAREHGGGGHHNAAGCVIEGEADSVEHLLVAALAEAMS